MQLWVSPIPLELQNCPAHYQWTANWWPHRFYPLTSCSELSNSKFFLVDEVCSDCWRWGYLFLYTSGKLPAIFIFSLSVPNHFSLQLPPGAVAGFLLKMVPSCFPESHKQWQNGIPLHQWPICQRNHCLTKTFNWIWGSLFSPGPPGLPPPARKPQLELFGTGVTDDC